MRFAAAPGQIASPAYMNPDVIVIDDDAVVLFLHKVLIKRSKLSTNVRDFLYAEDALKFIRQRKSENPLLIFLDINMPICNGWEFLDEMGQSSISSRTFVVMVTSSINESDREKAGKYPQVIDYCEKPLSKQACENIYFKLLSYLNS